MRSRCRHCRIFFLAHPRNAGRKDLGCPFGCREAHRKQESNQRSAAYYGEAEGKIKKRALNSKRKTSRKEASEAEPQTELGADLKAVADLEPELAAELEFAAEPELADKRETEVEPETAAKPPLESEPELAAEPELAGEAKPQEPGLQEPAQPAEARAQSGWAKDILEYVRQVTSLIEGRRVRLREVVQMVDEVLRQHSIARRRHIDHLVAQLHQNPP